MRTLFSSAVCLILFPLSSFVQAQSACANISCDCSALPTEAWQKVCSAKEQQLLSNCNSQEDMSVNGYCSIHGPAATLLPLSIELESMDVVDESGIKKLNYKISALYWSLHKDLDNFQEKISNNKYDQGRNHLKLIDHNATTLFAIQQTVTQSYIALGKENEAQKTWRDYSEDTQKIGVMMFDYGKAMLGIAEAVDNYANKVETQTLALKVLKISGRTFEQAGFAYANGVRHTLAAEAWKEAAEVSATIVANNVPGYTDNKEVEFQRYQTAMRLHKASYYWVIGKGQGSAEKSLANAQKFMENGEELRSLVEEEMKAQNAARHH